jgi:hypothetical protein
LQRPSWSLPRVAMIAPSSEILALKGNSYRRKTAASQKL